MHDLLIASPFGGAWWI